MEVNCQTPPLCPVEVLLDLESPHLSRHIASLLPEPVAPHVSHTARELPQGEDTSKKLPLSSKPFVCNPRR